MVYPYELAPLLTGPEGTLVEHDLDESGQLVPVDRPRGLNTAAILAAVVTTPTTLHPEGVTRVVLCGDPTKALGAVSEPECRRIIAAIDLAERMQVPLEWFALSAGARISMDSGTENMDWVAAALRRIVDFTQSGGEINVVVAGINVGAQPYWNAEATMLMHTKGILVMTPDSAMVLTGKQSLDFSGGVSAEDNYGIGGYDRVMGPNGPGAVLGARPRQRARRPDVALRPHLRRTGRERSASRADERPVRPRRHVVPAHLPGERLHDGRGDLLRREQPRAQEGLRHPHRDARGRRPGPPDAGALGRDGRRRHGGGVRRSPGWLARVPARDRVPPGAAARFPPDRRARHLHRGHAVPEVVEEGCAGDQRRQRQPAARGAGQPVRLRRLARVDAPAAAGVRRGDRPGDRELRRTDRVLRDLALPRRCVRGVLEGAELPDDRARGQWLLRLGHRRRPAAAVVFSGEVDKRAAADPRMQELEERIARAAEPDRVELRLEMADLRSTLRAEKVSEVAAAFDRVHDIHRAVDVGSVDAVIEAADIRPRIIAEIDRDLLQRD
jgi:hypothetical protein